MRFLLDMNICIYVINERPAGVIAQFLAHEGDGVGVSAITASELYWGAHKSESRRNLAALEQFLPRWSCWITAFASCESSPVGPEYSVIASSGRPRTRKVTLPTCV